MLRCKYILFGTCKNNDLTYVKNSGPWILCIFVRLTGETGSLRMHLNIIFKYHGTWFPDDWVIIILYTRVAKNRRGAFELHRAAMSSLRARSLHRWCSVGNMKTLSVNPCTFDSETILKIKTERDYEIFGESEILRFTYAFETDDGHYFWGNV